MAIRNYTVTLTGKTPLLMHHDNIDWADQMEVWKANPQNKKMGKAGDDRTPAFRWIGCLYNDGTHVAIPQDMVMSCLMKAGAMVPVPGAKHNKTFKSQTQSGMMPATPFWTLLCNGEPVAMADINPLMNEKSFATHVDLAHALGFDLYVKRAAVGSSKHIRVRPRFNQWSVSGQLVVWEEQLTLEALRDIFEFAGQYKGIGDWRPGGKTPGSFGMFEANVQPA